jgi:hypothetical protein
MEQIMSNAFLIMKTSGEILSATDYAYYMNKEILCPKSNYFKHIIKEFLNSLDGELKLT